MPYQREPIAAIVFFTDIAGFSTLGAEDQYTVVQDLGGEITHELYSLLWEPERTDGIPSVISMPTGDGVAITFCRPNEVIFRKTLCLAVRLAKWAYSQTLNGRNIRLRIGISEGSLWPIKDINGQMNVCGDTIVRAERIMSFAEPRQMMIGEEVYHTYVGSGKKKLKITSNSTRYTISFSGPFTLTAKHEREIRCYQSVLVKGWERQKQ